MRTNLKRLEIYFAEVFDKSELKYRCVFIIMLLYYYKDEIGNFGDDLNEWLWPRLFGKDMQEMFDSETLFLGIGSILDEHVPFEKTKVVLGSGYAYSSPPKVDEKWHFFSVRGPLTAKTLGIDSKLAITDAAILCTPFLDLYSGSRGKISFMPHHRNANLPWEEICDFHDIQFISPCDGVEVCLKKISESEKLITEAMHGAIIADCMRIPWIPVKTFGGINDFKWKDWTLSLEMEFQFHWLSQPITPKYSNGVLGFARSAKNLFTCKARLGWLKKYGKSFLSKDSIFLNRLSESQNALEALLEENNKYAKKNH
jgi:succinoglycan biosynthesis protein ExoV